MIFDAPEVTFDSQPYLTIQVRDAAGNIYSNFDTGSDTTFIANLPSAGVYYVIVKDGPYHLFSTDQYTVTIATEVALPPAESEPNNGNSSATPLLHNNTTWGQLASEADEDWLAFSVSGAANATIVFDAPEVTFDSQPYFTIQVRDVAGTIYSSVNTGSDNTFIANLPSAGTYYVVVKDGPYHLFSTDQYTVTLSSTSPPDTGGGGEIQAQAHTAIEITWDSIIGKFYVIEWTADLTLGSWFPLTSSKAGTGGEMNFLDSIRGKSKGFYRVKEQ